MNVVLYTLFVVIMTSGKPTSVFNVDGYQGVDDCMKRGYTKAHNMAIDPKTQEVKATCITTEDWVKLQAQQQ